MTVRILLSRVVGKQKNRNRSLLFQCSRKWKTKMESQIPFSDGVGERKTKLEVRIPFSHITGKRLALRFTHLVGTVELEHVFCIDACTLVPTVFLRHRKMKFELPVSFLVYPRHRKREFELLFSFFVFLLHWKQHWNFYFCFSFSHDLISVFHFLFLWDIEKRNLNFDFVFRFRVLLYDLKTVECVYLSANRFPSMWENRIWTSTFVFRLPMPLEFHFRFPFSYYIENGIPFLWNSVSISFFRFLIFISLFRLSFL